MLTKNCCVALAVLALATFGARSVSASGRGVGSHPGGRTGAESRPVDGHRPGNSGQFPRAENGDFRHPRSYANVPNGNAYFGWNRAGYGSGYGYGYGYPGWGYWPFDLGYELGSVPYFALFPPVYYGSGENMPALDTTVRSPWMGSGSPQPIMQSAAFAGQSQPPLRIINPYCVEAQADKPPPQVADKPQPPTANEPQQQVGQLLDDDALRLLLDDPMPSNSRYCAPQGCNPERKSNR